MCRILPPKTYQKPYLEIRRIKVLEFDVHAPGSLQTGDGVIHVLVHFVDGHVERVEDGHGRILEGRALVHFVVVGELGEVLVQGFVFRMLFEKPSGKLHVKHLHKQTFDTTRHVCMFCFFSAFGSRNVCPELQ